MLFLRPFWLLLLSFRLRELFSSTVGTAITSISALRVLLFYRFHQLPLYFGLEAFSSTVGAAVAFLSALRALFFYRLDCCCFHFGFESPSLLPFQQAIPSFRLWEPFSSTVFTSIPLHFGFESPSLLPFPPAFYFISALRALLFYRFSKLSLHFGFESPSLLPFQQASPSFRLREPFSSTVSTSIPLIPA